MSNPSKIKFTSQFGVARHPHISKPDSKGKYADDKYKVKLVFPINPQTMQMVAQIKEAAATFGKKPNHYIPIIVDEDENEIVLITKSQYAPHIFDSAGKPATGVQVGAGSVLRILGNIVPYDKGVTLQLNQVQIKELNSFGTCGFDAVEDGYTYVPEDAVITDTGQTAAGADDETANGSALEI